jgi:DnaJ-class molecular chaperone
MINFNDIVKALFPTSQASICGKCEGRGVVPTAEYPAIGIGSKVRTCPSCNGTSKEVDYQFVFNLHL